MQNSHSHNFDWQEQLGTLKALSESMLECARRDEWGTLIEAEWQRQYLMQQFFDTLPESVRQGSEQSVLIANEIKAILAINEQILQLGHDAKSELSGELRRLNSGRQVRQAYVKNSTPSA